MDGKDDLARRQRDTPLHEIQVQGHLDDRWAHAGEGLTLTRESDGSTTLTAPLADQAALHGLLNRIRDLNLTVVSVRRVGADGSDGKRPTMKVCIVGASG